VRSVVYGLKAYYRDKKCPVSLCVFVRRYE
jgi:hypothetical protein